MWLACNFALRGRSATTPAFSRVALTQILLLVSITVTTRRLALLGIAALVACSNSSTPVDLSALDLSGRWTLLDSATARQVDADVVYATVVARGTVVLAALAAAPFTIRAALARHRPLLRPTPRPTTY